MPVEVDLNGAWCGFMKGGPVMLQMPEYQVVPCFDSEERCRQMLYQSGAPMDEIKIGQISSEEGFLKLVQDRLPGVRVIYNLEMVQGVGCRGVLLHTDPESLH